MVPTQPTPRARRRIPLLVAVIVAGFIALATATYNIQGRYQAALRVDEEAFHRNGLTEARERGLLCSEGKPCRVPGAAALIEKAEPGESELSTSGASVATFVVRFSPHQWRAVRIDRGDERAALVSRERATSAKRSVVWVVAGLLVLLLAEWSTFGPLRRLRAALETVARGGGTAALSGVGGSRDTDTLALGMKASLDAAQRRAIVAEEAANTAAYENATRSAAATAAIRAAEAQLEAASQRDLRRDEISAGVRNIVIALLEDVHPELSDRVRIALAPLRPSADATAPPPNATSGEHCQLERIVLSVVDRDTLLLPPRPATAAVSAEEATGVFVAAHAALTAEANGPLTVRLHDTTITLSTPPDPERPNWAPALRVARYAALDPRIHIDVYGHLDGHVEATISFPAAEVAEGHPSTPPPPIRSHLTAPQTEPAAEEPAAPTGPSREAVVSWAGLIAAFAALCWFANDGNWWLVATDIGGVGAPLFAGYRWLRHRPSGRRGWWLLGAGCIAWAVGDLIYDVLELAHLDPFPSPGDLGYLLFAVALIGAIRWVWPSTPATTSVGYVAEAALMLFATIAALWGPVLGPLFSDSSTDAVSSSLLLLYAAADLAALASVTLATAAGREWTPRLAWFNAGLVFITLADIAYMWLEATGGYEGPAPLPVVLWFAGFITLGVGAGALSDISDGVGQPRPVFPLLWAGCAFVFALGQSPNRVIVICAVAAAFAVIIRDAAGRRATLAAAKERDETDRRLRRTLDALPASVDAAATRALARKNQSLTATTTRLSLTIDALASLAEGDEASPLARAAAADAHRLLNTLGQTDSIVALDTISAEWAADTTATATLADITTRFDAGPGFIPESIAAVLREVGANLVSAGISSALSRLDVTLTATGDAVHVTVDYDGATTTEASLLIDVATALAAAAGGQVQRGRTERSSKVAATFILRT